MLAQAKPALEQLDPPERAAVLMALLGLVLLGITLVVCTMLAGRWIRRYARHRIAPKQWPSGWKTAPPILNRPIEDLEQANDQSGETQPGSRSPDETKADG